MNGFKSFDLDVFDTTACNDTDILAIQVATIDNPSPIEMIPAGVLSFGLDYDGTKIGTVATGYRDDETKEVRLCFSLWSLWLCALSVSCRVVSCRVGRVVFVTWFLLITFPPHLNNARTVHLRASQPDQGLEQDPAPRKHQSAEQGSARRDEQADGALAIQRGHDRHLKQRRGGGHVYRSLQACAQGAHNRRHAEGQQHASDQER